MIKDFETDQAYIPPAARTFLMLIDRDWLEQRLYEYEEEQYRRSSRHPSNILMDILDPHEYHTNITGIHILGEADQCVPIMQSPPFPSAARMPRETWSFMSWKSCVSISQMSLFGNFGNLLAKEAPNH